MAEPATMASRALGIGVGTETGKVWAGPATMTSRAGGKGTQKLFVTFASYWWGIDGRERSGGSKCGRGGAFAFVFAFVFAFAFSMTFTVTLVAFALHLSRALPLLLLLCKSGSSGLKSCRSRKEKAPEELGVGERSQEHPQIQRLEQGSKEASSVGRSESASRHGVLLRSVGSGVVLGKSETTYVEAEPAGKGLIIIFFCPSDLTVTGRFHPSIYTPFTFPSGPTCHCGRSRLQHLLPHLQKFTPFWSSSLTLIDLAQILTDLHIFLSVFTTLLSHSPTMLMWGGFRIIIIVITIIIIIL